MDPNQNNGSGDLSDLINSFNCLGTNNKEDLIRQFLGFVNIDPNIAGFYLEANNWNLQLALNAFMDVQLQPEGLPEPYEDSEESEDYTLEIGANIVELVNMLPSGPITIFTNTKFQVGWQLHNVSPESIPAGTQIVRTKGPLLGSGLACVFPTEIEPGAVIEVTIELTSPTTPGTFRTEWNVLTANGDLFGQTIFTDVTVIGEGNGIDSNGNVQLGPTDQSGMHQFPQHSGSGATGENQPYSTGN